MRKIYTFFSAALLTSSLFGQQVSLPPAEDTTKAKELSDVVVTGQYKPQSVKNSVYDVKVINNERIRLSGATNVQQVLNNQLGFRFSNDNTLGTSDVQLMGMSGRNVKILLDGVPLIDRGDTRESLNQIDLTTIERIEIINGPMSVSYGSDALAGVINIITKKNIKDRNILSLFARTQEETAGSEYHPFNYKGVHTQSLGLNYQNNNWGFNTGGTHNDFSGFGGDAYGRDKDWLPKEQWLGNAKIGYSKDAFNIYYRIDGLKEDIISRGPINLSNFKAIDQQYLTNKLAHQVQASYHFNNKAQLSTILGYTDYKRQTKTYRHDFEKNTDELTAGIGEQDVAKYNSFVFRNTLQYQLSSKVSLQPGIDINREEASGQRIAGNPSITDYAAFISAEIKPTEKINIRPGVRFIKNSVYDAPPVVPSINSKFILSNRLDLRLAYAYGFRSPALRELYFDFVDANHNIVGNPNLKAENSNSFTGSLNWTSSPGRAVFYSSSLSGFYNDFKNQIDFALSTTNQNQYTYFNVNNAKTTGGTFENRVAWKKLDASLGLSYIGKFSKFYNEENYIKEDTKDYLWTPELTSSIGYTITKIKTKFNLFYKYSGKKLEYLIGTNSVNQDVLYIATTASYHLADFTTYTTLNKCIAITAGVKNIFDVSNVNNTATSTAHAAGGTVAMGYGRSYFLGLNFQWNKK